MDDVIIIEKVVKGEHGHHGGAWKVAYADFVTAMMAFFLLLWLLNATTEDQKQGIADYFAPVSVSTSTGGAGGMLGGQTISAPGALTSRTAVPSVSLKLEPTSGAQAGDAKEEGGANDKAATAEDSMKAAEMAMKEREDRENAIEEAKFDRTEKEIKETISKTPELKGLEQHLLIDKTPEGMRIQVIDKEGKPMFAGGSAKILKRTEKLVRAIGNAIATLDNKIRISEHTDSVPFKSKNGYSNWELSSERAQASRRVLASTGLFPDRISSVAGRASLDPLLPDDPKTSLNRRISILLLRQKITEKAEAAKKAAVTKVRRAAKQKKPAHAFSERLSVVSILARLT